MNTTQIRNKTQAVLRHSVASEQRRMIERRRCYTCPNGYQVRRGCGLDIPVRFVLISVPEGYIIEEGSARVYNISPLEILVSDIEIPSRNLPLKPFQVILFIEQGILERIHMLCSVRWINNNGTISLGLHIDQIPERHRLRLSEFIKELEDKTKQTVQKVLDLIYD